MTAGLLLAALLAFGARAAPAAAADARRTLDFGGLEREYFLHVPPAYDGKKALPLVLMLHGGGGPASSIMQSSGMSAIADREGFLVAYPQGVGKKFRGKIHGTWNAGRCCGPAKERGVDDVGFLTALLERLSRDFRVDARRVFVSGHSNGGIMAYRLARESRFPIAAIAPVSAVGDPFDGPLPRAVSVFHVHGVEDRCVPYKGGDACGGCFADFFASLGIPIRQERTACEPVPGSVARWGSAEGCPAAPSRSWTRGPARCEAYGPCRDGAEVELCSIPGQGHAWPGAGAGLEACRSRPDGYVCRQWIKQVGPIVEGFSASEEIWSFLRAHPRASAADGHGP